MNAAVLARVEAPAEHEGLVSGAVLRAFRRSLGLSQKAFAQLLIVDIYTYRSWESGRRALTRVPVYRFRALCRALVAAGVTRALIGALDVALDLDLDIARALASGDDLFPPDGCSETWQALLQWTLGGPAPLMLQGLRTEPPRVCPRDLRVLTARAGWELGG